jgi:hypothetical protein
MNERQYKKNIKKLYDIIFDRANDLIKQINPCNIQKEGGNIICNECRFSSGRKDLLCCSGCRFHSVEKGCTANKPLGCKLWLCHTAKRINPELEIELSKLRTIANKLWINFGRKDKEESIKIHLKERFNQNSPRKTEYSFNEHYKEIDWTGFNPGWLSLDDEEIKWV